MAVFAVTYLYVSEPEKLDQIRPAHRAFLGALHEAGGLIASGPLAASIEDDPFRREGLIAERTVREWLPVIGSLGR